MHSHYYRKGEKFYEVCEFGSKYIQKFCDEQKATYWNKTQLYLLAETMVNFIDTITEAFMKRGYPGDPIWIFEQLRTINEYGKKQNYVPFGDEIFQGIEKPLRDYRHLISNFALHQKSWLSDLDEIFPTPIYLCMGHFSELRLHKLQEDWFDTEQMTEGHDIVHTLLTTAITTIRQSQAYQDAKARGHLRYNIEANLPKPEPIESNIEENDKYKRKRKLMKDASPKKPHLMSSSRFFSSPIKKPLATSAVLSNRKKSSSTKNANVMKRKPKI